MTISATYSPAQASGNGATVAFPFTFKVFSQTDLTVILTSSAGVNTTQAITTDYTVSINADQNNNPGGTVTMLTAPATGETLIITRVIEELQETDITNGGGFYPEVLENALDRLTMLNQQNTATTNRALVAPLAEASIDTLPSIVDRASKYLAFDADGQPVATSGTANAFIVTGFAETLLDDANAAAMRATLGSTTVGDAVFVAATAAAARTAIGASSAFASANTAGQFNNLGLAVTMAANACTIALKGADGNDPSAANPVTIAFRSATQNSGVSTSISVTAPLSLVIPSGATIGSLNNLTSRIWIVAINNAGSVELAARNCVVATARDSITSVSSFKDLDQTIPTVSIGTGADSADVFYSTTARTDVVYAVLGAFDSAQTTAGTWASSPVSVYVDPPFRPGHVVSERVLFDGAVATGTTTIPDDDTIPQITEGDQFMQLGAAVISPTSLPNVSIISATAVYANSASVVETMTLNISGWGGTDVCAAVQGKAQASGTQHSLSLTKAIHGGAGVNTAYIRLGGATAGTTTFNGVAGARKMGGVMSSFMRITEISA